MTSSPLGRLQKIAAWWQSNAWAGALILFFGALLAFTVWMAAPTFTDPDSFYHIKVAEIMSKKRQALVEFPWLAFTTLKDAYVDHHFLYHLYLVPFVRLLDPIVGMKLATALLAASTIGLFYLVLRARRVPLAMLWGVLLLCTEPFAFRMGLAKAPSVAFLFLMGAFYLLIKKQFRLLFLLSFFYVWSYGGFVLVILLTGVYSAFQALELYQSQQRRLAWRQWVEVGRPVLVATAGVLAGLLFHPSFPQHLQFYWEQVIQIGVVNYRDIIGVGAEWYPFKWYDLTSASLIVSSLVLIASVAFAATLRRQTITTKTASVLFFFFLLFTLKSHRYIEYYIPWAYLFAALTLTDARVLHQIPALIKRIYHQVIPSPFHTMVGVWIAIYLFFMIPGLLILQTKNTSAGLHSGIPVTQFQGVGKWLRDHSNKGDIVFHNDWDDFPTLFYQSEKNYYIVGLDPTFMYRYNEELYWKWVNITIGQQTENVFEIVQHDFGARFVLVDKDHTAMKQLITADKRFKQVYQDEEVTLYRVPREKAAEEEVASTPAE